MMESFAGAETELIIHAEAAPRLPPDLQRTARRKLLQLHAAARLQDLAVPPGHRLEALKGARAGQNRIRVKEQWRICFRWESGAHQVEIVDNH